MEIKLRRVILSRRTETKTFTLRDGLEVFYYGEKYGWEDNPERGEVKEKDGKFIIYWDDGQHPTEINESEKSKSVLKYCGF